MMKRAVKIAVTALWLWDFICASCELIEKIFEIEWLCSFESALAVVPACTIAAFAISMLPKRKSDLNFSGELFHNVKLRPTFD